jgi:hypothetical protein
MATLDVNKPTPILLIKLIVCLLVNVQVGRRPVPPVAVMRRVRRDELMLVVPLAPHHSFPGARLAAASLSADTPLRKTAKGYTTAFSSLPQ